MRSVLPLILAALAITACGPESENKDKEHAPLPYGYELASATATPVSGKKPVINVTRNELATMQTNRSVRLVDIRTTREAAEGARIGAKHIVIDKFYPSALDETDGREVVVYCRSAGRSYILDESLSA